MSRVLLNVSVFVLGVLLAFAFALRGRLLSFATSVSNTAAVQISSLNLPSKLDSTVSKLAFKKERRAISGRAVDSTERLTILKRALEEGTPESLDLLRSEFLRVLPSYQTELLPELKRASLEGLFKRFSDVDWKHWPEALNQPTRARSFVNDLTLVNSDLGNFVETAGHLLHGMYVNIGSGEPYSLEEDLFYLGQNSEEILKNKQLTAVSAKSVFDTAIIKDPAVVLSLEQVKTQLTKQFAQSQPDEIATQVRLFTALDARAVDKEASESMAKVLRALSLKASLQFRADVFPDIVGSKELSKWAKAEPIVAKPLGELYLVGALDALETGRISLARKLLERSDATYRGLPTRKSVKRYLDSIQRVSEKDNSSTPEADSAEVTDNRRAQVATELAGESVDSGDEKQTDTTSVESDTQKAQTSKAKASSESSSFGLFALFKWLTIVLIALAAIRMFLVYLARQQEALYGANLPATIDRHNEAAPNLTDPGDIQFDVDSDDSDLDFGIDNEIVNR